LRFWSFCADLGNPLLPQGLKGYARQGEEGSFGEEGRQGEKQFFY
jgi:hypothetical protein